MDTTQDQAQNPNTTFVQPQQQALPVQQASAAPAVTGNGQSYTPPAEFDHPSGGAGQPQQGMATTQSEPTPQMVKPPIDPRPLAFLRKNRPDDAAKLEHIAEITGVSPERQAAHWYAENRLKPEAPRGADGEIGPMQMLPSTAANYTLNGRLDPFNPDDNHLMSALYMRDLDNKYGKDSFASVARYNGSGPHAAAYARKIMPTAPESAELQLHGAAGSMKPDQLVRAGAEGGPDGFLRYAVSTAPAGMPTSDIWRQAEASLVEAFVRKGDVAGAQHARDFVLQMSHTGSNQYLMAAHQALSRGDGVGAANYLAKAHAFFPDGTIGRFRTDGRNVYAERMDENDPSQRLGPASHISPTDIAGLLNQTTDPAQYLKTLNEQQKAASDARLKQLHGDYYAGGDARAAMRSASQVQSAQIHGDALRDAATIRANAQADKPDHALARQVDKETSDRFNTLTSPDATPELLGQLGERYSAARHAGVTPPQAERIARGTADGSLEMLQGQDGHWAVVSKADKRPVAYLPAALAQKFLPQQQQQPQVSPIGAGASSAYAMGAGVTSNLSGTVMPQQPAQAPVQQSSAIPVRR